jgi:hypothetical protein
LFIVYSLAASGNIRRTSPVNDDKPVREWYPIPRNQAADFRFVEKNRFTTKQLYYAELVEKSHYEVKYLRSTLPYT